MFDVVQVDLEMDKPVAECGLAVRELEVELRVLESCLLDLQDFVDDLLVGQQLVLLISLALAQIRIKIGDEFPLVPLTSYGLGACRPSAFGALDIGNRSC